jgi:hypothetical protein
MQIVYKDDIIRFFEKKIMTDLGKDPSSILDSPALLNVKDHGLYFSKIIINIYGMQPTDNFQLNYKNTEPTDGNLIETTQLSSATKVNTVMY